MRTCCYIILVVGCLGVYINIIRVIAASLAVAALLAAAALLATALLVIAGCGPVTALLATAALLAIAVKKDFLALSVDESVHKLQQLVAHGTMIVEAADSAGMP